MEGPAGNGRHYTLGASSMLNPAIPPTHNSWALEEQHARGWYRKAMEVVDLNTEVTRAYLTKQAMVEAQSWTLEMVKLGKANLQQGRDLALERLDDESRKRKRAVEEAKRWAETARKRERELKKAVRDVEQWKKITLEKERERKEAENKWNKVASDYGQLERKYKEVKGDLEKVQEMFNWKADRLRKAEEEIRDKDKVIVQQIDTIRQDATTKGNYAIEMTRMQENAERMRNIIRILEPEEEYEEEGEEEPVEVEEPVEMEEPQGGVIEREEDEGN